jgi:hypothetical protein
VEAYAEETPDVIAVQEAGNNGLNDDETALLAPSVCTSPSEYVIPAGEASDNWLIVEPTASPVGPRSCRRDEMASSDRPD